MELTKAEKFVAKQIRSFEESIYQMENIMIPRYEADKNILISLRDQHVKLTALIDKQKKGEEITQQDIFDCVPKQFR